MVDQISDKNELLKHYRECDIFVMPSFTESFGMVYAEAMSQGLPVIYTKGEGIDGYFEPGEAGFAVDPGKPEEIVQAVQNITGRYMEISGFCSEKSDLFNRDRIGLMYKELYQS